LFGGFGDDTISGGACNDILHGDEGRDVLAGGSGANVFHFRVGSGIDTITDFTNGVDTLFLDENLLLGAPEDFDINDFATLTGGNLTLLFMIEETITFINGITIAQLSGNIEFEDISLG
jgi:Ca2+-binding RTX toxin-like protein